MNGFGVQSKMDDSIQISERAAERVRQYMAREGGLGLRLGVRRTGCSGWAYEVGLALAIDAGDRVFDLRGVKVVIDQQAWPLVAGTSIDFGGDGLNRAFRFKNPNVTGECGCGESFAVNASPATAGRS